MRNVLVAALAIAAASLALGCAVDADQEEGTERALEQEPASEPPPAFDLTGAPIAEEEDGTKPTAPAAPAPTPAEPTPPAAPEPAAPAIDPGPKPTGTCSITKDADGFFVRSSGKSDYVAYVPTSYSANVPMRAIVGMHGCGDTAGNFARWGINPAATRATQEHIGISVGGESGNNRCWSMGSDDAKVLAAVDDLSRCFWIHRAKVVVAGFSSGGQLAYRVGLAHADRFAGILVEHASLYAAGDSPDGLLASAAWKIHVAHRAATSDSVFPIAKVRADWAKTKAAGFPLTTSELAGGHDGDSDDWVSFLLPASAGWTKP